MAASTARFELLGPFHVTAADRPLDISLAGQRVLALLAISRQWVTRERIAGILWPEARRERSQARLRSTLWRLGSDRVHMIEDHGDRLRLCPSGEVDLYQAEDLGRVVINGDRGGSSPRELIALFSRDLLPDWYEPWLDMERQIHRELRVRVLEALARDLISRSEPFEAVAACLQAIRADPFRDTAHHILVQAYRAEGNIGSALRHIRQYRVAIWEELHVSPGRALADLESELTQL
jgi:DNA-binding SARP family transcriptional activator